MCSLQTNVPPYPQSHHQQTTVYSQQLPATDGPYWLQDVPPQENTVAYNLPNQVPQEASYGDFPPFTGDLFQPEEIFQLDQPLRPDFPANPQDVARSPPTLLDLGSGTIKYEVKQQDQTYWNQFLSEDSSSSHLSLPTQDERLQFSGFEPEKDSNGLSSRRAMHHYVQEKNHSQGHPVNDTLHYHQNYFRPQNQKGFGDGNSKSEHEQQSYWPQDQQDNRLHFPGFEVKEEDLLPSHRHGCEQVDCYNRNGCQTSLAGRTEYNNLYQRSKSEDTQDAVRSSRSPEDRSYSFDGYHHQMFDHGDSKTQSHGRVAHHQNTTRMNLDDRLQAYDSHEATETADRLFHGSGAMENAAIQSQNSQEPFLYPNNERCHYTCEILDRLPQMMNNTPGTTAHGANVNNYNEQVAADLDLPPFVDYTLVGMLCSSADEEAASSLLPAGCSQDSHSYVPHH